jgi:DNA-binding transcriptional ArsR family regulator
MAATDSLSATLFALADPTRRGILAHLAKGDATVKALAEPYDMSVAAVSKHLKVLESAELIARERRGSFQIVKLKAQSLKPAEEWIAFYSRYWNRQFDKLDEYLEGEEK